MVDLLALIAIPSYGKVSAQWMMGRQQLSTPLGAAVHDFWLLDNSMSIAEKRNAAVEHALQAGAKYLFFLGDDTIPPPHAFVQLLQKMRQNPELKVITGVYFSRSYPPQPMLWRGWMEGSYYNWHVGEFFEVDWAGCDCLMIDMDVFKSVPKPWFSQDYVFDPRQQKPIALATEDIYFYEKARRYGYPAWCDASVQCIHQDRDSGASFYLPADWPQRYEGTTIEGQRPDYLIADLGAGTESPYTTGRLVRIDLDESVQPDIRSDLRSIPVDDQHFDEVWSRHVLEHFSRDEAPKLVQEWCRILKIGGRLMINVPNVEQAFRTLLDYLDKPGDGNSEYAWWQIYGQQAAPLDYHKNGFTQRLLEKLLEYAWGDQPQHFVDADGQLVDAVGCLSEIHVEVTGLETGRSSLQATAVKVRHPRAAILGPEGRFTLLAPQAEMVAGTATEVEVVAAGEVTAVTEVPEVPEVPEVSAVLEIPEPLAEAEPPANNGRIKQYSLPD